MVMWKYHDDDDDHYCNDVYDDKTRMMPILMKLMTMMILLTMLTPSGLV